MVTHSPTMATQSPIATKATVVMHSSQTTQALTTLLLTTTVPAVDDETSLSARKVFLYITVPGVVVLIFLTICGLILLTVMVIRYKKQAKLDNGLEGRVSPKIITTVHACSRFHF